MTVKARLNSIEHRLGSDLRPELGIHPIYYERKEGGADWSTAMAFLVNFTSFPDKSWLSLSSRRGETPEMFVARICDEVEEHFGARPSNEEELKLWAETAAYID